MSKSKLSKKKLIKLYKVKKLSANKIARLFKCTPANILYHLNKYSIKRRKSKWYRIGSKHSEKTKKQISLSNIKTKATQDLTGKNNPFFRKHHTEKTKNKIRKSKYHTNLKGSHNPMFGKPRLKGNKSPNWKGGKPHCKYCGKSLSAYSCKRCKQCTPKGKLSRLYIHGNGNAPYPLKFNNQLKLKIRTRDTFKCQFCGIKESKVKYKKLDVHHIDYNKFNCSESNLITLCNPCNVKANHNHDYWYAYCTYLMENR